MYKVFVNNTPIILTTQKHFSSEYTSIPIKKANLINLIEQLVVDPSLKFHLYHTKEEKLLSILQKKLPVVVAGGGKVYNSKNKILFIYRNGFWDLPKGKAEKGESIEETSIREVEEETGITGVSITRFLTKTYHIFKRNGQFKLKLTYWFEMYTENDDALIPQTNEGITKVKWKSLPKCKKALRNSYANITQLFPREYLTEGTRKTIEKVI